MVRRLYLFARDWFSEWGIAWSLARMRDCERNGGHRWGKPYGDPGLLMWSRTCRRCGCSGTVYGTQGTTATNAITVRVDG